MKIIDFFKINDSYKIAKISLFFSTIVAFISYALLIAYRVVFPDTIIEGITYYMNATWAITGCGRWLLPILSLFSGNVVMPPFVVMFYVLTMWLCAFLICKMWNINNTIHITIISMVMSVTPAAISQLVATYMGVCFALACLFSTLYAYVCFKYDNVISYFICIICIIFSLALYQSYISNAATLVLFTIIIYLLKNEDIKDSASKALKAIITALCGCVAYVISNKVILTILHLESSSRLSDFSVSKIIPNLFSRIKEMYLVYFNYFNDHVLLRRYFYIILLICLIISLLYIFKTNNSLIKKIIAVFCLLLIPLASNLIGIAVPDYPITALMTYQYILIIPFIFSLIANINNKLLVKVVMIVSIALCWTHIVSANATYQCYKLTYDHIYNQYSQVIYDIQHTDKYIKDETPVIIVGFFDDSTLRKNIKTYNYAINSVDIKVFWETLGGATYNVQRYVMQYFGLDFKDISIDEYLNTVNSNEIKLMKKWPDKSSIAFINDYLVVKLSDNFAK